MHWLLIFAWTLLPVFQVPIEDNRPVIRFSGYEWNVKTSRGHVGPGPNIFSAQGVQVDEHGYLHLRVAKINGRWVCSEVISTRSFGYGTYRFVVHDTATLDVNAVLGLFLWDTLAADRYY